MSDSWGWTTPWTAACQSSLSLTISWSLLKHMSTKSMMSWRHLIFFCPLHLSPQWLPASGSFPESALPMNIQNWFHLGLTGLIFLQSKGLSGAPHQSSKASILWCSTFFIVQLSHPHMTTRKTKALIRWTFVGKIMSLLFKVLLRLVIAFLPRSKHLLISWLQSPSAVILKPPKIKFVTVSHLFAMEWWDWLTWS